MQKAEILSGPPEKGASSPAPATASKPENQPPKPENPARHLTGELEELMVSGTFNWFAPLLFVHNGQLMLMNLSAPTLLTL